MLSAFQKSKKSLMNLKKIGFLLGNSRQSQDIFGSLRTSLVVFGHLRQSPEILGSLLEYLVVFGNCKLQALTMFNFIILIFLILLIYFILIFFHPCLKMFGFELFWGCSKAFGVFRVMLLMVHQAVGLKSAASQSDGVEEQSRDTQIKLWAIMK